MREECCELCERRETLGNRHGIWFNPRHANTLRLCGTCAAECGPYEFLYWCEEI